MIRLVIDTDVMVAAFDSPGGASRRLLLSVLDGQATLLLSPPLMVEYEAVLMRPKVLRMIGISPTEVLDVLDELAELCVPVGFDYQWRPLAHDPDDDFVVETAINGLAEVIATFNVRDMASAAARFGISVEPPATVLMRIRQ